jgi:hypothetical protein
VAGTKTAVETRPQNYAMLYCIRALP